MVARPQLMKVKVQRTRRTSFSPQPGLTSEAQMFLAIRALDERRELSALLITAAEMTPTPIQETAGGVRCLRQSGRTNLAATPPGAP